MKRLTDEQLGMLPTWFSKIWNKNRERDRLGLPAHIGFEQVTVDALIIELAHALEQVAAAKLMAEALEAVEWGGDTYCLWCGSYWKKPHSRDCKRKVALAAWKALETTQDGDDDT